MGTGIYTFIFPLTKKKVINIIFNFKKIKDESIINNSDDLRYLAVNYEN